MFTGTPLVGGGQKMVETNMVMDGIHLHGVSNPVELYSEDRRSIKEALIFSLKLLNPLMKEDYDVVDCQGFPFFSCFTSKIHSVIGKSKLIITLHEVWGDYWYTYLGKPGIFGVLVERVMLSLTDNIITVSSKTKMDLKNIKKSREFCNNSQWHRFRPYNRNKSFQ